MKKIIALGGSNSKNSINKSLAAYVAHSLHDVDVDLLDLHTIDIPMYGIDQEQEHGIPERITEIDEKMGKVDGIVVSLAEHNGAYTAAFKSFYDWLSRVDKKVWKDKPMFLMATSPGGRGGLTVLGIAEKGFPFLGGHIITTFSLPFFGKNFSTDGILDVEKATELKEKLQLFQQAL